MNAPKTTICLLFLAVAARAAGGPSAEEILRRSDEAMDPGEFTATLEMSVRRPGEEPREYRMAMKGADANRKMVLDYEWPARVKGQALLKVGEDMWFYLPGVNKTLRVPGRAAFGGGDFSNSDVLVVRLADDYAAERLADETAEGVDCYQLKLAARRSSAAYASITCWIEKAGFRPVKRVFHTVGGKPFKTLLIRSSSGGRPDTFVMSNALEQDRVSEMRWRDVRPVRHPAAAFTQAALVRRR